VAGFLVSYIRAKAESLQIECRGGFAERTERLIILLTAIGFTGLGVEYILTIGIWFLAIASVVTVIQRLRIVWKETKE
jgi:CDP-diacylglycerol--glycerol-3-phosphate 3-phosphatidyltransferase